MFLLTVIIAVIAANVPVCGKLYSIPHHNPGSCPNITVRGHTVASFFNSLTLTCKGCSQPYGFQRSSKNGDI